MKSKVIAAVGISGLLMAGGVLSASASTSGYDLFKTAVKKTQTINSFSAHIKGSLTDNDKVVYQVDSINTENLNNDSSNSSTSVSKNGTTTKVDFYSQDNKEIVKSSNDVNYYVKQEKADKHEVKDEKEKEGLSPAMQKDVEAIFDALTKNYQDSITTKDISKGHTQIELDLSKNQIPTVGQAVVSFFLKNIDQKTKHEEKQRFGSLSFADLKPQLPQLKNNISVSRVVLQGDIDKDQYLVGQKAEIFVSGDDLNGKHHDLVLHLSNQFDNLNNANVSNINLTGKKVVKVQEKYHGHEED
ncbi:hypothetical protein [Bacillus salipaludis]|uniref:Uncharacterized protein n=1 Tax=Bacillus salipaludis TaxID=2547811 RepID=A0AA90TXB1_9BACI|nr:hypothetical protein [Bacillus salipaludis]MDQ6601062.1 hypothetical protein [Bacillus salipaludis]